MQDLISRQAAIDELHYRFDDTAESWKEMCDLVIDALKDLPSTQPLDPCETCLHKGKSWDEEPCDGCTQNDSKYEPDNGWIPVSERLPEGEEEDVWMFGEGEATYYLVTEEHGRIYLAKYIKHDDDTCEWDEDEGHLYGRTVTAWMPMPDPYKEEER